MGAAPAFVEWVEGKTWPEIYNTCEHGDRLLWLFNSFGNDKRLSVLVGAKCIEMLKQQMTEDHLIVLQALFDYGNGKITEEELNAFKDTAVAVLNTARKELQTPQREIGWAFVYTINGQSGAGAFSIAWGIRGEYLGRVDWSKYYDKAWDVMREAPKKMADIVREFIPIEKFNL